mgnify:CR=1 FL=1|jgi:hypothetical protein
MNNNITKYINITECSGAMSVDFIFAIFVILIILQGILALTSDRMDMVKDTEELGSARMVAESVAETIDATYSGGEGQSTMITLPPAPNKEYRVIVSSSGVYVKVDGMIGKACVTPHPILKSGYEFTMHPEESYNISTTRDGKVYRMNITEAS